MRERYRVIARVEKPHGRFGEVVTQSVHGLPLLVREGLEVAVVPPELKGERWGRVLEVQADDRSGALVRLEGICELADAEALAGRFLLAREADLPADLALHDAERLCGREVAAQDGSTGTIAEVMQGPANDVWVVRGEKGELLIPVIDSVVSEVAPTGPIQVVLPAGLDWEEAGPC